jgi:uncharacterized protein (UPF0548 family)
MPLPESGCLPARQSPARSHAATTLLVSTQGVTHEPKHRRPKTHEQGSALGILTLVLADGFRANPERKAEQDGEQRKPVEVATAHGQLGGIEIGHRWSLTIEIDGQRAEARNGTSCTMTRRQPLTRRWSTAARWPVGVVLTSWRYIWHTTPTHRWELPGSWPEDAPPELPSDLEAEQLQLLGDGVGPLVHRIYRTRIVGSALTAEKLMARMTEDLDCVAPSEFATFQKLGAEEGPLSPGDEYVVRMPGPWDGPVRVVSADVTSFQLVTLDGHLEAGQIEFRVAADYRSLEFEIESWARSGDRLSDLLYTHLRLSKEVQLHMWSSVLRRIVKLAEGRMDGGIAITTRVVEPRDLPAGRQSDKDRGSGSALATLAARQVNFDATRIDAYLADASWRVDDLVEPLPNEGSGPPAEGGSWRVARRMLTEYQLADPAVVTAVYDREAPLASRNVLLTIRFAGLRFRVGVRIRDVYEETVHLDGRPVHLFGWDYLTLEGHFEEGQMHYEIWKWLDTGEVEFHLRAVSRPATRGPFFTRTGFRLFGRTHQLRFYRQVCRRARRLTEAQLETDRAATSR